jgi:TATA-binding protein-associated factor
MDAEEDAEPPIPATIDSPHISGKDIDEDGDLGMEIEAKMSPKALTKALGFRMGLPPSFNTYRSRSGSLSWDFDGDTPTPTPEDLEEIKLHWHQLAGVHSIIRHVFIEGEGVDFVPGMLVGDEVGLGKMAQAITTMALLNQIIYAQKNKLECPPVVGEYLVIYCRRAKNDYSSSCSSFFLGSS